MGKVMAGILEEGRWGVMGERRWEDMAMIGVKVPRGIYAHIVGVDIVRQDISDTSG